MRVAISSQNFRSITGHAGKTRRFIIYEVTPGAEPVEEERLDLPAGMSLHDYHGADHPLFARRLDLLLTASAGPGFVDRMQRQGVRVVATGESDIATALGLLAAGQALPAAAPHDHDHGHDRDHDHCHEHQHGHGHGHGGHGQHHDDQQG